MIYTIKDLSEGKCAVIHDGTIQELKRVLKAAFPNDLAPGGHNTYYYRSKKSKHHWLGDYNSGGLPYQSVKEFIKQLDMEENKWIPQRGELVLVRDMNTTYWEQAIYLETIEGAKAPYITVSTYGKEDKFNFLKGKPFNIMVWKQMEAMGEPKVIELTIQDISDGKGVGVPPELIRIKK